MANTKTHPGSFRCWEAAFPDEPVFVILGRDPAAPATLEFWAHERVRQDKTHTPDDKSRIAAAIDEAKDMAEWRQRMLDHAAETNDLPVWKLPRPGFEPDRPTTDQPEMVSNHHETMKNQLERIEKQEERISRLTGALRSLVVATEGHVGQPGFVDAREHAQRTLLGHQMYWQDASHIANDEDGVPVKMLSASRIMELLDYATAYGEFSEDTPSGTETVTPGISTPMNDMRRSAIWCYKRVLGLIPEDAVPPVADDMPKPQLMVRAAGLFKVPGVDVPQTHDQLGETYAKLSAAEDAIRELNEENDRLVRAMKKPVLDSQPDDLAHAPEVPHHRFSVFHTHGEYAYARGLEINPIHLPMALDAMQKSGWALLAIFGQTDSQHIGFVFERRIHDAGINLQKSVFQGYRDGDDVDAVFRAILANKETIQKVVLGDCSDRGRGCEP